MENKDQNGTLLYGVNGDDGVASPPAVVMHEPPPGSLTGLSLDEPVASVPLASQGRQRGQVTGFLRFAKRLDVILVFLLAVGAAIVLFVATRNPDNKPASNADASRYATIELPLDELIAGKNLALSGASNVTINGYMQLNNGLSLTPSLQPTGAKPGQLYYDQGVNQLAYFNGQNFVFLTDGQQGVQSLGGATGQLVLGGGLGLTGQQLTNTGVLTVQGQTGNVSFTAGSGIILNGTTLSNSGVISISPGSANVSVVSDGNGNITIDMVGAGTGTVTSSGGVAGSIPLFTASQNIENSIISQSGLTVTISGDLSVVTGGLSLSNALTVSNGGTGTNSLAGNGVLVGNGTSPVSSVAAGLPGLCLLSSAGAPTWAACPSAGGVTSLNGLTGALNIANASAAGSTITIDDASTSSKGIASFNGTNFTVTGGAVNTVQNINTAATPTFAGVNTNTITPGAALTVGISAQTALLQGSTTTITSNGAGNNIVLNSAGTIELQDNTNVTGNLAVTGDLAVNGGDITSSGALNITPGGALTIGAAAQPLTLQGGASSSFRATSGANTTVVGFTSPVANTNLNFPALAAGTYTICTSAGNCAGVAATLQSAYDNSSSPEIILDATRGGISLRDNATPLGANLLEVQNNDGTITYLAVTSSGIAVTGTATVSGNVNASGGALQTAGTTRIDNAGNATNIGSVTLTGAISGGTTYTGSGNINTTAGGIQTNSTTRIDNSGNLINIAAVTASGNATFQGGTVTVGTNAQAGSVVLNDGSANTGTLQVAALGQNTTYIFPDAGGPTATVCLTTGNCAGVGGGITGSGTTNAIPLFTGAQTIGDSIITQSGTTVDIAGTLTLSTALGAAYGGTGLNTTPSNGQLLIGDGSGYSLAALANNGGLTITNGAGSIGLAVNYGAVAGTAVQGSVTLTCPSGTGNLTGGGDSITLGSGGTCSSLSTVNNPTFATSVTTPLLGSSGALNITPGGALTVGATTQTALLQGSVTTITSSGAGNDIVLTSADQIRFTGFNCTAFANGGVLTTDASGNIACADDDGGGSAPTFQSVYDGSNPASFTLNNTNGGLIINDNATPISGPLFAVQNDDGSTSFLEVSATGISVAGTVSVSGNITTSGDLAVNGGDITSSGALNITPGGTLTVGSSSQTAILQGSTLTLSSTGAGNDITFTSADQIVLNASGTIELQDNTNVTGTLAVTGAVTGSTYNGQTISSSASFTGTLTAAGTINTTTGALQTAGTTRIDNSGNLANIGTITATGAATIQGGLTLGASGTAGSFVLYDGGAGVAAHTGTIQVISTLAQNTAYILPDPGGASATICLSTGNCAGAGGGITGSGTTDRVAKFTASGTIGDSTITDDGVDVSITGNFTLQGGTLTAGADAQVGALTLYDGGTGAGAHTTSLVAGSSAANLTFVLPTGAGSTNQCLKKGSGDQLVWDNCDGGAGGSSATFQSVYDNSSPASFTLDSTNGGLIINDNATPISGTLFAVQNNAGSTTYLNVTNAGVSVTGAATVGGNINTSSGVIQTAGTTRIDGSGNLLNIGGLTLSGAISGGTTYTGSGNINTTGGALQTNSTTRVDNSGNLVNIGTITASGNATLQGGMLTLGTSGQAGTLDLYDGGAGASAFIGTLRTATLAQDTTFTLPDPGVSSATICLSTGNCAGSGGGVTTAGGTTNRLPVFSGAQVIADSWLLQNGSTLEIDNTRNLALIGGDLTLQGGNISVTGTIGATGDITSDTQLRILESAGATFYGILDVGDLAADQTFTFLQGGTVVTSANIGTYATTGVTAGGGLTGGGTTGALTLDIGAGNGIQVNANDIAVVYGSSANTAVQGNTQITVTAGTNLTGGGTLTLGAGGSLTVDVANSPTFSGNVVVQGGAVTAGASGQAGTLTLYDGGAGVAAHTATLQAISTLGQNTVYTLPDPVAGSATICLSTGNCAGAGAGITGSGTTNRLAKYSAAQNITDSTITDDGTNVTTTVDMVIQGGAITLGTASQTGTIVLHDGDGDTTTLQAGNSTGNLTFILPVNSGSANQCLKQSGTGNQLVWQDCDGGSGGSSATLQTAYNNSTDPEITLNSSVGGVSIRDNATPISGNLFEIQNSAGGTTYFGVNTSGTSVTGTLAATGNINTSGGAIQTAGTTRIDNSGNLVNIGTVAAGTYNGQTISSSASFTGTLAVTGNTTLTGDLAVNGGDITSSGALNITPGGTLTVGATGQQLVLQGNANTTLAVTGGGFTTTVGFDGVPVGNVVYNFDRTAAAGSYDICTSAGNCLNVFDNISGSGTVGVLPVFTGSTTLGDSLLSQSGSTVTVSGNLNLATGNQFQINGTQISSANLSNDANLAKLSASQAFTGNTVAFQNAANSTNAFNIQNSGGARLLTADTQNAQIILGVGSSLDGKLVFNNLSNNNTVTILPGTPSASRSITLPDADGIICLDSGNCAGAGATLQTAYNFSVGGTMPKIKVNSTKGGVDIQDADTTIGGSLFTVRGSNSLGLGAALFDVDSTGAITLQNAANSASAFRVLTLGGTNVFTADTQNGQILLGQSNTLTGQIVFRHSGSGFTGSIVQGGLTADRAYTLPDATGTICLTTGNCASSGGGVTTSGGTTNRLPVFNGAQTLADSWLLQNTSTLELDNTRNLSLLGGNLSVTGNGTFSGDIAVNGGDITSSGALNITPGGALTVGATTQTALLQGSVTTITSSGAGNDIILNSADTIELQDNTAVTGNLQVQDATTATKAYRLRTSGTDLDFESGGAKMYISNWTNADFTGTQRTYLVLENAANMVQAVGAWHFRTAADGTTRHTIDGSTGTHVTFNQTGESTNFSVQGDSDTNLLFVQGSTDRVGIGTNTPGNKLDVSGTFGASGNVTVGGTYNTNTFTSSALTFGAAGTATVSSAASQALNITSNAAATWSTSSGNLGIQAQGNLNLGNGGGQTINIGTNNAAHTITIGNQGATGTQAITIGGSGNVNNSVSIESGSSGTINIGNGATGHAINIGTGAAAQTIQIGSTNSTSSTTIQGGSGNIVLTTSNGNRVQIGSSTTDAVAAILTLDSYNNGTDPTGTNGAMYYNTSLNTFRCYQAGAWMDCITASGGFVSLQNAYTNSTGGTTPEIKLDSTRGGVDIQDANTTIGSTASLFAVRGSNSSGLGTSLFMVQGNGNVGIGTGAPDRPLHVAATNTTTDAPTLLIEQVGTGDTSIELKDANSKSFFIGMDASDGGAFKIASSTSAGTPITAGITSTSGSYIGFTDNKIWATKVTVGATGGTVTSVSLFVGDVDNTNPGGQVALYADNSGEPGALIDSSGTQTLVDNSWNTFPLSATVNASTTYWLARNVEGTTEGVLSSSGGTGWREFTNGFSGVPFGTWPNLTGVTADDTEASGYTPLNMTIIAAGAVDSFEGVNLIRLTDSGAVTFQNSEDSGGAFSILNAAGSALFNVNTGSSRIDISSAFYINTSDLFMPNLTSGVGANWMQLCIFTSTGSDQWRVRRSTSQTTCGTSSLRYKENVSSMEESMGLEVINALRPVTYTYKNGDGKTQVGLIAEEVEQFLPEVVAYDDEGRPDGINYEFMVANLIKAIQQQQVQIDDLRQGVLSGALVEISGHLRVGGDTTGTAVIPAGQTSAVVTFGKPYQFTPKITTGSSQFVPVIVTNKTKNGFTIQIQTPQATSTSIDWTALEPQSE